LKEEWNLLAFGNALHVRTLLDFIVIFTGITIFLDSDYDTHAGFIISLLAIPP
jgi:hypothetical protein